MTATEIRPVETELHEVPLAPMERRERRVPTGGAFARRLPWAFVVVALAVGYGIGQNNGTTTKTVSATSGNTPAVSPEQINEALSGNGIGLTAINDRGYSQLENGFQHKHTFPLPLTPAQQRLLAHQMVLAREAAMRFPTLGDAYRAGLRRQGPYSPGLGTHMIGPMEYPYIATSAPMTDAQILHPLAWIYDGTHMNSPVAGLMYTALTPNYNPNIVQGFAGPNDVWHIHKNVCQVMHPDGSSDSPLGADRSSTQAECAAVGGKLMPLTPPLLHVWPVPGYESPEGVFSHTSTGLTCNDGTYHEINLLHLGRAVTTCADGTE